MQNIEYKIKKKNDSIQKNTEFIQNKIDEILIALGVENLDSLPNESGYHNLIRESIQNILDFYIVYKIQKLNKEKIPIHEFRQGLKRDIEYKRLNSVDEIDERINKFFGVRTNKIGRIIENIRLLNYFSFQDKYLTQDYPKFLRYKQEYGLADSITQMSVIESKRKKDFDSITLRCNDISRLKYFDQLIERLYQVNSNLDSIMDKYKKNDDFDTRIELKNGFFLIFDPSKPKRITLESENPQYNIREILELKALQHEYYHRYYPDTQDKHWQTLILYNGEMLDDFFVWEHKNEEKNLHYEIALNLDNMLIFNNILSYLGDNPEDKFYELHLKSHESIRNVGSNMDFSQIPSMGLDSDQYHRKMKEYLKEVLNEELFKYIQIAYLSKLEDISRVSGLTVDQLIESYPLNQIMLYSVRKQSNLIDPFDFLKRKLSNILITHLDFNTTKAIIFHVIYNTAVLYKFLIHDLEFSHETALFDSKKYKNIGGDIKTYAIYLKDMQNKDILKLMVDEIFYRISKRLKNTELLDVYRTPFIEQLSYPIQSDTKNLKIPHILTPFFQSEIFYAEFSERFYNFDGTNFNKMVDQFIYAFKNSLKIDLE